MKKQQEQDELSETNQVSSTPVNGKRTIQPKKAFLLALGSESEDNLTDSDEDVPPNETAEEKKARKEAAKAKKQQQLLMDQMDGVPLSANSSSS